MGVSTSTVSPAESRPRVAGFVTLGLVLVFSLLATGCGVEKVRRDLSSTADTRTLNPESPFLKAHLKDGRLIVFRKWSAAGEGKTVVGTATVYSPARDVLADATVSLPVDSVAIFETNVIASSGSVAGLAVMTAASAILSVVCLSNPKTCFGSCPTFYVNDVSDHLPLAEGFSASIAPALEATDIDALPFVSGKKGTVELVMKNEALETHVVRRVRLLSVRRPEGWRVFYDGAGGYWRSSSVESASSAVAGGSDITASVGEFDRAEYFSKADSTDLASREIIDLTFKGPASGRRGIVIAGRQSLMSTFLLYQTLAYLGHSVPDVFAALSTGDSLMLKRSKALGEILGGIDVEAMNAAGEWSKVGEVFEVGPLATDVHLCVLPDSIPHAERLRLRLTKGAWRIDWIALARLEGREEPVVLEPVRISSAGKDGETIREKFVGGKEPLTTFPGDQYTFTFSLPEGSAESDLFLETRGYYIEWMREQWYEEENPLRVAQIFFDPEGALRDLAPEFKKVEPTMEAMFWNSRYAK